MTFSLKRLTGLPLAQQVDATSLPDQAVGLKTRGDSVIGNGVFFSNISVTDWFENDDLRANDFLRRLANAQRTGLALG